MTHYNYLIIGGGMAAAAGVEGIREVDGRGSIGLISAEKRIPYNRPPLSKKLWTGQKQLEDIFRSVDSNATLFLGHCVEALDLERKLVTDDHGHEWRFGRLLLATGGTPRRLPFGGEQIMYYRTLDDYERLLRLAQEQERFAVIGGGFVGSEVAAALAMKGRQVSLVFPEATIGARIFPAKLGQFLNDYYRQHGVEVLAGEAVVGLEGVGTELALLTASGRRTEANVVVAGIGVELNTALAEEAGLKVENGIVVDESLRTSHPDVYAAGDVVNYYDRVLGMRRRVEHAEAANTMGWTAGRAMAGAAVSYDHTPMFYSDLFDLGYEAVGLLDSRMETVVDWQELYRKGVIYYLEQGRVRGVLLWNVWERLEAARALIAAGEQVDEEALRGRI